MRFGVSRSIAVYRLIEEDPSPICDSETIGASSATADQKGYMNAFS
jgi:hypothetical protein